MANNGGRITVDTSGPAARLTLRRPPLNFLDVATVKLVEEAIDSLGSNPPCRALVLDAEGAAFCAGLEASELNRECAFLLLESFHQMLNSLNSFPRPTIAIVRGMAVGAGCELISCCDFVIAGEKALFGHPEVKVGCVPSLAHLLLPPLIGARKATEMITLGNLIGAAEATDIGLVTRVVPDDRIVAASEELIRSLSTLSAAVLELALQNARRYRVQALGQNLKDAAALYLERLLELEDQAEGIRALSEKRSPRWRHQ
jgi:cyclohexa-1,5-dienecarbonyl-CoA hydratase